ncbi:MAG: tRNA 2-thiouridine(34) synthase MnmA [Chloroflexi bacterium]|nr:tRNA 2-thiouridine(34) synthase MnmA [Chloroflexota bacterium]
MAERVLVAMSGGVDSAVAAALLHRQGYDVVGVTLRLYTEPDETALRSGRTCCGIEDIGDARAAAQAIGIPHYVLNMEHEFERDVLDEFVGAYARGETPNPCLNCNQYVKFDTLLQRALAMGVDRLATGHYARIERDGDMHRLHRAIDDDKDQSYVLYTLGQEALARTVFPLGGLTKAETRAIAREAGLPLAEKPDSVDICFVPGGDYRELLDQRGVRGVPGAIERADGTVVGEHAGITAYTIGQRRGLGFAEGAPRFVTEIIPERNVIVIGGEGDLYRRSAYATDPRWVLGPPDLGEPLHARIRYHAEEAPARLVSLDENSFTVEFDKPVRAPAPGQAIVLYRGTEVVGGGTLRRPSVA